jgi:RTX calcium-binding nonapeptide repeat (4 copies)
MAITKSGSTFEDPATGLYRYGVPGPGSLSITAGDDLVLVADAGSEPQLIVGLSGVTLDGAGSTLTLQGNGAAQEGVFASIGWDSGGGAMSITNNAGFRIEDLDTSPVEKYWNSEWVMVGRDFGGLATLTVDGNDSIFSIIGGAPELTVGYNSEATASFSYGAELRLQNVVGDLAHVDNDNYTTLAIGDGVGSQGGVTFDATTATIDGGDGKGSGIDLALNGAHGALSIGSSSTIVVTGGWDSAYADIGFGSGSVGELHLTGTSSLTFKGPADYNGVRIGAHNGTAEVSITGTSQLQIFDGSQLAYLEVGLSGGNGTLTVDQDADVLVAATGDAESIVTVGGWGGGTGTAEVKGIGSTLTIRGQDHLAFGIGYGDDANGTVQVEAGASVLMESKDLDSDQNSSAYSAIGAYGGHGTLSVAHAYWMMHTDNDAGFYVGRDNLANGTDAGTGSLLVEGGYLNMDTTSSSFLGIAGGTGSSGTVRVVDGGVINMDGYDHHDDARIRIASNGGAGVLLIDGWLSAVREVDYIGIGYVPGDPYGAPGGSGSLIVTNGGTLYMMQAPSISSPHGLVEVGSGGTIGGGQGNVYGDVELESGGKFDLTDGTTSGFYLRGDLRTFGSGNKATFEFSAAGNDLLGVEGNIDLYGDLDITLTATDGYQFAAGETRTLISTGQIRAYDLPTVTVAGQHSDFAYYVGLNSTANLLELHTLNNGSTGGPAAFDFGAGYPVYSALLTYDVAAGNGIIAGGRLGEWGSRIYNVDAFFGTAADDELHIVNAVGTQAFTLDGRDGNDDLLGGSGADRLFGGAGSDRLNGGGGNDRIDGSIGADTMSGGTGNDALYGGAGSDWLDGGNGVDTMVGGADSDTYIVDNSGDRLIEYAGGGTDTVRSSVSYSLASAAAVENLTLVGAGAIKGTGNSAANTIIGNAAANLIDGLAGNDTLSGGAGNDTLKGGLGKDRLTGGAGKDYFAFTTSPNTTTNRDVIVDFAHGQDRIQLENAIFTKLGAGTHTLSSAFFRVGSKALDGNDYIVYNKANGVLSYDNDGSGSHAPVQIAVLLNRPTLTASDFVVI